MRRCEWQPCVLDHVRVLEPGQGGAGGGQGCGAGGFWIRETVWDEGVGEREGLKEIRINRIVPCFWMLYVL